MRAVKSVMSDTLVCLIGVDRRVILRRGMVVCALRYVFQFHHEHDFEIEFVLTSFYIPYINNRLIIKLLLLQYYYFIKIVDMIQKKKGKKIMIQEKYSNVV